LSKVKPILIITLLIFLTGCDLIIFKEQHGQNGSIDKEPQPVARVHEQFLYNHDLDGLIPNEITKADSINLAERYIQSWINKQLVIEEASRKLDLDEAEIERKVLDYRYALMIHEFQMLYINEKLNTRVTENEISQYFEENKDNFELRRNIIKGRYIKLPVDAPKLGRLRRIVRSDREADLEELRDYCYQYATTIHLDTLWIEFNQVVANTPVASLTDKSQFLKNTTFYETSDDNYLYFIRIFDYKLPGQIKPLEFVRDEIENIIINKRKVALAKQLEDQIYNKAERNKEFEIYEND